MARSQVLGLVASNRSRLTIDDEKRLLERVVSAYNEEDFHIYDPSADVLSRAMELMSQLTAGLDASSLTNSEMALVVSLVSAKSEATDVELLSLVNVLKNPREGARRLKAALENCESVISASPVYFGDRSSVLHGVLDMVYHDTELQELLCEKVFCGISVGAKRNGGQETMLIYQLLDFLEFGVWGVGNDALTTSQYGGTCMAGDIGTILHDSYGVVTSQGTGRRAAFMSRLARRAHEFRLVDKPKVGFLLLQDAEGRGEQLLQQLLSRYADRVDTVVFSIGESHVAPCKGCKLCPASVGPDSEYRCAVRDEDDFFVNRHPDIIGLDALVPVFYSPRDKRGLRSTYQQFVERTRYLRRSDYILANVPVAAMVFEEPDAGQNLHVRVITSLIRHQTIVLRPMVVPVLQGKAVYPDMLDEKFGAFLDCVAKITAGRYASAVEEKSVSLYNAVGYTLNYARDKQGDVVECRRQNVAARSGRMLDALRDRIVRVG